MLYKLDRTAAREAAVAGAESATPVFKMKKTREELRLARKLLEENVLTNALTRDENDEAEVFESEDAMRFAHEAIKADLTEPEVLKEIEKSKLTEKGREEDHIGDLNVFASDDPVIEEDDDETADDDVMDRRRSEPPAYVVSHPWAIVDYHLYLCSAERGQTLESRRDGTYLFDGADCRPLSYNKFAEDRALLSQCSPGDQPHLLFGILPIADRDHFADRNPSFGGRHYVLGFDYHCKTLYARHFDWFPHDLSDIWCVWDNSANVYTVTVPDLIHIMDTSLGKGEIPVGMGILSSSQYCLALESDDDPGLEIIIATLWCQWLLDFSEILFKQETGSLPHFQERLASYVEQGRLILQRASYRAWFAVRDGYSKEQYRSKMTINQYTNDLYTFEKSEKDGSLKGQPWVAPGLETCNQIRHNERLQRKKRVEQRLEDLFVAPETEVTQDQESVLRSILAKTGQGVVDLSATAAVGIPRTPSPKSRYDASAHSKGSYPESPVILTPATEPCDEFGSTAYHHIPLSMLLERALDLVHARPELDTIANREQFGDLLVDMGVEIHRCVPGSDSHGWKLHVRSKEDNPSPLIPNTALE
ncbi:hypothetical protein BDW66DRAFT_137342 [Aspergillus desertorum]